MDYHNKNLTIKIYPYPDVKNYFQAVTNNGKIYVGRLEGLGSFVRGLKNLEYCDVPPTLDLSGLPVNLHEVVLRKILEIPKKHF